MSTHHNAGRLSVSKHKSNHDHAHASSKSNSRLRLSNATKSQSQTKTISRRSSKIEIESTHKITTESASSIRILKNISQNEEMHASNDKITNSTHEIRNIYSLETFPRVFSDLSTVRADLSGIFDPSVVPQELVDELYEDDRVRPLLEGSSFYELFDRFTESGTAIKWYRKVKEEEEDDMKNYVKELKREPAVKDVGGGITRSQLEKLSRKRLQDLVDDMSFQLEYYKAENFILDNTVQSLEKREMEIEKALPAFTFTIGASRGEGEGKVTEKVTDDVCKEDLSSDEENFTGQFESFVPEKDVDLEDEYFANMSEKSKEALQEYFQNIGEVAPSNYDPFLHRYGDLVRPGEEEIVEEKMSRIRSQATSHSIGGGAPKVRENIIEDDSLATNENSAADLLRDTVMPDPVDYVAMLDEEDPDFPDFVLRLAKTLPIQERLKYSRKEEVILKANYEVIENREIVKANKIIVYTDTYMRSFKLLKTIFELLQRVIKSGYHPLTGKMKAEDILRFRRRMKNMVLAEETKLRMIMNEYRLRKNKVDRQVRDNRDLGESIQAIDYDQLKISNLQYQHKIDEQHELLNQLKLITALQLDRLKILKQKVHKKVILHAHIVNDIQVRNTLKQNFDKNFAKHSGNYQSIKAHNDFLQKRLRQFHAPSTLDYMEYKKLARDLEQDVHSLRTKIDIVKLMLSRSQSQGRAIDSTFPTQSIRKQDADWFRNLKEEVKARKLVEKFTDDLLYPTGGSMQDFLGKQKEREGKLKASSVKPGRSIAFKSLASRNLEPRGGGDSPPRVSVFTGEIPAAAALHHDEDHLEEIRASMAELRNRIQSQTQARLSGQQRKSSVVPNRLVPGQSQRKQSSPAAQGQEERRTTINKLGYAGGRSSLAPRPSVQQRKSTLANPPLDEGTDIGRRATITEPGLLGKRESMAPAAPHPSLLQRRKTIAEVKTEFASAMRAADLTTVQKF